MITPAQTETLLVTLAQCSAAIVAIIAGFLLTRALGLTQELSTTLSREADPDERRESTRLEREWNKAREEWEEVRARRLTVATKLRREIDLFQATHPVARADQPKEAALEDVDAALAALENIKLSTNGLAEIEAADEAAEKLHAAAARAHIDAFGPIVDRIVAAHTDNPLATIRTGLRILAYLAVVGLLLPLALLVVEFDPFPKALAAIGDLELFVCGIGWLLVYVMRVIGRLVVSEEWFFTQPRSRHPAPNPGTKKRGSRRRPSA